MFEGARRPPDRSSLAPPQPAVPLSRSLSTADVEGAEARGNLKESDPLRIPDRRRQGPKRLTACDDIEGSRPRCRWGVEATLSAQKLGASRSAAELGTGPPRTVNVATTPPLLQGTGFKVTGAWRASRKRQVHL